MTEGTRMSGSTDWTVVAEDEECPIPSDRPLAVLVDELIEMLRSPDPVLRDELAYPILASWIDRGDLDPQLPVLGSRMTSLLSDPRIQARTFAAVVLAEIVHRDTSARQDGSALIPDATLLRWRDAFTSWWVAEEDLRGWDDELGWLHAIAHGADLLAAFAASPQLDNAGLAGLLDLVADRLLAPTDFALVQNEDDRVAYATMHVLLRDRLDVRIAQAWIDRLATVWTEAEPGPLATQESNTVAFLRALHIQLQLGVVTVGEDEARRPALADELDRYLLVALSSSNDLLGTPR
jgi:hypothetical protein